MISFSSSGSTAKTQAWLKKLQNQSVYSGLERLAQQGVAALEANTPKDTDLTASSWGYEIVNSGSKTTISWLNTNVNDGVHIAILLQYDHGTGSGGFVAGRDYINPAMKPIFDQIADDVWKKVTLG